MMVVLAIIVFCPVLPFVLCLMDKWRGTHYSCKFFGWHEGWGGRIDNDGLSLVSQCQKCGKDVMLDSQGNWFSKKV